MALNIVTTLNITIQLDKPTRLTRSLKHHRNPSGFMNKVRWLLSESKRDLNELKSLKNKIINPNTNGITDYDNSWRTAFHIAECMINANESNVREYLNKIMECSCHKDEKTWYRRLMFK